MGSVSRFKVRAGGVDPWHGADGGKVVPRRGDPSFHGVPIHRRYQCPPHFPGSDRPSALCCARRGLDRPTRGLPRPRYAVSLSLSLSLIFQSLDLGSSHCIVVAPTGQANGYARAGGSSLWTQSNWLGTRQSGRSAPVCAWSVDAVALARRRFPASSNGRKHAKRCKGYHANRPRASCIHVARDRVGESWAPDDQSEPNNCALLFWR
jgi:hypothetical protein